MIGDAISISQRETIASTRTSWCSPVYFMSEAVQEQRVHKYVADNHVEEGQSAILLQLFCAVCQMSFRKPGDFKRYKFWRQTSASSTTRSRQCERCPHWLKSSGGPEDHAFHI